MSTWCSKHVEAWNKLIIKFSASSWLILKINICFVLELSNTIYLAQSRGIGVTLTVGVCVCLWADFKCRSWQIFATKKYTFSKNFKPNWNISSKYEPCQWYKILSQYDPCQWFKIPCKCDPCEWSKIPSRRDPCQWSTILSQYNPCQCFKIPCKCDPCQWSKIPSRRTTVNDPKFFLSMTPVNVSKFHVCDPCQLSKIPSRRDHCQWSKIPSRRDHCQWSKILSQYDPCQCFKIPCVWPLSMVQNSF